MYLNHENTNDENVHPCNSKSPSSIVDAMADVRTYELGGCSGSAIGVVATVENS